MAETEDAHWWFAGRRRLISALLHDLRLPAGAQIIELGAGTGGNLALLARFGTVAAMEYDERARQLASAKSGIAVLPGRLPDQLPFPPAAADVVCLFDVLEHVEADRASLLAIRALLKPSGRLLLSVPLHPRLWSEHDVLMHHFRRYTRHGLVQLARGCGYRVERLTPFNATLLPVAALVRRLQRHPRAGRQVSGIGMPPPVLNRLLTGILAAEAGWARHLPLPFGLSLFAVLTPA